MIRWRRGLPIAVALLVAAALAALVLSRVVLRTDMLDLLPRGRTEAARFMLAEVNGGPAARLVLVGIDGAPADRLAAVSRAMADRLRGTALFESVENGAGPGFGAAETAFLFDHRYLLSPAVTPAAFAAPALHDDLSRLVQQLRSSASALAVRFGLADPQGVFLPVAQAWLGASRLRMRDGVWFAPDRDRALLLLQTRAAGMDVTAQDDVVTAIHAAFDAANPGGHPGGAQPGGTQPGGTQPGGTQPGGARPGGARPGGARLLLGGAAVFARDAAATIRGDVRLVSSASVLLIVGLLLWRFRSPWAIAAIFVPITLGVAAGALAVQLAFGFVHGVALGFGITMLGVTADYPVLLIGHRKLKEPASGTIRRIGRAFTLAVTTALLGLTGMLFSGFAGLAQIGLFSVAGLATAAAATRWLLPPLIVAADLAPVPAGDPARLLRIERLRAFRAWALLPVGLGLGFLLARGGLPMEHDLAALSPVPAAALATDASLRAELGAPDAGQVGLVSAPSEQAVLEREEALLPALDALRATGAIGGAELAARLLPSVATQRRRQAMLPDAATLDAALAAAAAGLPLRPQALRAFPQAVAAARAMAPLTPSDVTPPLMRGRLAALLVRDADGWHGLIVPSDVRDPARLRATLQEAGATYIELGQEANGLVATYTGSAWRWLGWGGLVALLALLVGLRDIRMALRVAGAIASALLLTVAILVLQGARLSLLHIVALQFVCGIGLDYALFFARRQLDQEERARTLRTLFVCNAMTVLSFGLLALCRTPLLRQIGVTVAIGAVCALVLAFLVTGAQAHEA
jgi:predicted exporter